MEELIIHPIEGLCNRLRVIFSYLQYANSINKSLLVIWEKTERCNGYFDDYFEPIENVTFIKYKNKDMNVYYRGYYKNTEFNYPCYKKLKLKPIINNIINEKLNIIGNNYISIHIRRTDHSFIAKQNKNYTNDDKFITFIENNLNNNLYIATDNLNTYNIFYNRFKNKIKFKYHIEQLGFRKTTLQDSIIDLFMCVNSYKFMGSGYSSFSGLINKLRKYK